MSAALALDQEGHELLDIVFEKLDKVRLCAEAANSNVLDLEAFRTGKTELPADGAPPSKWFVHRHAPIGWQLTALLLDLSVYERTVPAILSAIHSRKYEADHEIMGAFHYLRSAIVKFLEQCSNINKMYETLQGDLEENSNRFKLPSDRNRLLAQQSFVGVMRRDLIKRLNTFDQNIWLRIVKPMYSNRMSRPSVELFYDAEGNAKSLTKNAQFQYNQYADGLRDEPAPPNGDETSQHNVSKDAKKEFKSKVEGYWVEDVESLRSELSKLLIRYEIPQQKSRILLDLLAKDRELHLRRDELPQRLPNVGEHPLFAERKSDPDYAKLNAKEFYDAIWRPYEEAGLLFQPDLKRLDMSLFDGLKNFGRGRGIKLSDILPPSTVEHNRRAKELLVILTGALTDDVTSLASKANALK